MNKHFKKAWLPAAATSLLVLGACEDDPDKDSELNTDLLIGEWEVVTRDGETPEDEDTENYRITMEFQADGDFSYCFSGVYEENNYHDCYDGEWEWTKVGETIGMTITETDEDEEGNTYTDVYEGEFVIQKLTESALEGTWKISEEGEEDEEISELILKKI